MVGKLFSDVVSLLDRRHRERRIRNELEALSDKELSDIGLTRGDIDRIARESSRQQ